MKKNTSFLVLFILLNTFAFSQIKVKISGEILNYADTVRLSQIVGNRYVDLMKKVVDKKGNYTLEGTIPAPDYYVFRIGNQQVNLVLRNNSDIKIYGDSKNLAQFNNIVNSNESIKLNEFVAVMQNYNMKKDSASRYLQNHPDQEQAVNQSFSKIFYDFETYKSNFLKENENSPALIPMISLIDTDKDFPMYEYVVNQLIKGFIESPSVLNLKIQYEQLKAKKESMSFLDEGKLAPDFSQAKMDGTQMKLSDLKGKVVLLDFWASWCGPCRKENPNVVKLYEKYKNEGFTVMSVSLDKDKNAWAAAIAKDNLSWPNHVSDLKHWGNEAAKLYKVSGIPFTVLIDRDGKIINKNLRGIDLENKLKSIFGH
ncbi:MAG: redoxin family protein [Bacteroidota bacterium]